MDSKEQKEIICYRRIMFGCYSVDFGKYVRVLITGNTNFQDYGFAKSGLLGSFVYELLNSILLFMREK